MKCRDYLLISRRQDELLSLIDDSTPEEDSKIKELLSVQDDCDGFERENLHIGYEELKLDLDIKTIVRVIRMAHEAGMNVSDYVSMVLCEYMDSTEKAIAATSNRLELPSKDDGFTDMVYIKVVPPHFETELYVEEAKTVTFREVLHQTNMENVIAALKSHYKSSENGVDGYRELMDELLGKKPVFSKYQISIEHVNTGDEEYEHVSGVIPGDEQAYGIEFNSREEWLGMHLTEDTLKNYSNEDIIAHCLWEMTFFGFTDSEVQKKKDELIDSCLAEDGERYTIEDGTLIPEDY